MQVMFISAKFLWESKSKGGKSRVARGLVARKGWPRALWPEVPPTPHPWQKSQENESFVLRTYRVGSLGVKKFTYRLMGKGGTNFPPRRHDYPNVCMCGGLLAWILIMLQSLFVHFVYVTEGRQLTKVVLWASLWTCSPSPLPFLSLFQALGWIHSLKVLLFPASGDDI